MNIGHQFKDSYTLPSTADNAVGGSISLVTIRKFLGRQWRLILLVVVLSVLLAIAYVAVSPMRYTAQADMLIDTKRVTWTQTELATENRFVEDASVESEIETTKSEKVALDVIRKLNLTSDPEFVGTGKNFLQRFFMWFQPLSTVQPEVSSSELERWALGYFKGNLRVVRLGRSYIEQISFTSLDREKAAKIANAVADAYAEDQLQAKFEATRRASVWLQHRISELRQQASDAYREVQDFKSANSIIISADGKLASEIELDQLGTALARARADTTQARAKLERISRVLEQRSNKQEVDIPDPIVTDALSNPVITRLRQQYLDNQNRETEWSTRYGPDHQAARNLRAENVALQRAIWDEVSRIAESYKSELQIARSQEDSIEKRMLDVFDKSNSTRQAQVRLRELETAANTYRNIYETFLSRFTQSVQQQSFPSTEARIVTFASPPRVPSSPKVGLTLALAVVSGLALGVAAAFARERLGTQIFTRAQLENLLGVSCTAVFPEIKGGLGSDKRIKDQALPAAFEMIAHAPPLSATAEALRYMKVAVDLHPTKAKVIGFVSALPREGKTTIAASLATFVARNGARTLLIDADLRNPSLTRSFGYAGTTGLREVVSDHLDYKQVVISDLKHQIDLLPASAKSKSANGSEILSSQSFKDILKAVRQDYDYVFVDLPPILPVVDVRASAYLFDAFLIVVEWGATPEEDILKAIKSCPAVSERLLGSVLNKANETMMRRLEGDSERRYAYYSDDKI